MSTTTPTPSDAAMAAARDFYGPVRADCEQIPAADKAFTSLEIQLAELIDQHFAPLREELALLKTHNGSYRAQITELQNAIQKHPLFEVLTTLRAENDKLRAQKFTRTGTTGFLRPSPRRSRPVPIMPCPSLRSYQPHEKAP